MVVLYLQTQVTSETVTTRNAVAPAPESGPTKVDC